jgi:hypothetical protein
VVAEPPGLLLGSQVPTHRLVPEYEFTRGDDSIELGGIAGYQLDEYQQEFLRDGLGVVTVPSPHHPDGRLVERWASFENGIELSRQNGKSVSFEVRALSGLYLFRERRIVYSAHKGETVMDAFRRIADAILSDGELKAELKPNGIKHTNGKEAIELRSGQILKFRTRTAGGGRGLYGDCVILDESQDLNDDHLSALMPVVSAQPNPQLWYGGSAGGKKSTVQGRLVRRCANGSPRLVYWRFAADEDDPPGDPKTWAKVNPALGRRIALESIESEYEAMSAEKFGRERLGIGDYPREEGEEWVIPRRRWEKAHDPDSTMVGKVAFAVEVSWDMLRASIGVAGYRPDRGIHLEVIANEVGKLWVVDELKRLMRKHPNLGVVLDPGSPANTLIGPLRDAGIDVHLLKTSDLTAAFGSLYTGVMEEKPTHHHRGGTVLTAALSEASTRNVSGSTTWKRAGSVDVSPLLSVTWAAHALSLLEQPKPPPPAPRPARKSSSSTGSLTADLATAAF